MGGLNEVELLSKNMSVLVSTSVGNGHTRVWWVGVNVKGRSVPLVVRFGPSPLPDTVGPKESLVCGCHSRI